VANAKFGGTSVRPRDSGIDSKVAPREDSQLQSRLQIKEGDSTMFEFFPHYSLSREAQAISIEFDRSLQVVDTQCKHRDA
jgi:hypothetical protein